jgi:hypothetical protein
VFASERDGQAVQASDQHAGAPGQALGRHGQAQVREALDQRADRDLPLQPRERRAETIVDALPEDDVLARVAGQVERLGI